MRKRYSLLQPKANQCTGEEAWNSEPPYLLLPCVNTTAGVCLWPSRAPQLWYRISRWQSCREVSAWLWPTPGSFPRPPHSMHGHSHSEEPQVVDRKTQAHTHVRHSPAAWSFLVPCPYVGSSITIPALPTLVVSQKKTDVRDWEIREYTRNHHTSLKMSAFYPFCSPVAESHRVWASHRHNPAQSLLLQIKFSVVNKVSYSFISILSLAPFVL